VRIDEVTKLEDCFDGSAVFRYRFDRPWSSEAIQELRALGALDYFPAFPRPFFRLRTAGGLQARGVQGECCCQVILPGAGRDLARTAFEENFEKQTALPSREV